MADEIPRLRTIPKDRVFELGKKIDPDARSGWLKILKPPTPATLKTLESFVIPNAARIVVEVGGAVPLSVLAHLEGVPFVILGEGRKSFDGLEALPRSVRRLSIRKHGKVLALGGLPASPTLEELELDAPGVSKDAPALPALKTLGWTSAKDDALGFIERQPALVELGLKSAQITRLPAVASLERLLLFAPSKLVSLKGADGLGRLKFLRIDQPKGMKRLGDLKALKALSTIVLIRGHAIADLSDLGTAPALETLNVVMTQLDPTPFKPLRGKLKGGAFQLKGPKHGMELLEHLGVPYVNVNNIEPRLFDFQ